MARQPKRKTRKTKPAPDFGAEPGPVAALNVILEQMQSQMTAVAEGVTMTRESLERKIGDLDLRLSSRMDTLEFVVRQNSRDIQKNSADIQKNSADIQKLNATVETLADKLDANTGRVAALEQRVEVLEA